MDTAPDDGDRPERLETASTGDLDRRSWTYVVRKTVREFSQDQCTDLAAALTYYSVLSIFPAALALLSVLGVLGEGQKSVDAIADVLRPLVSASTLHDVEPTLRTLANTDAAPFALVVGFLGALWSASAYVGAFSRAMNRIFEVREGRPFWKMRPMQLVVTLVTIVLCAVALVLLVVSGPVATSIGHKIGVGDSVVLVWNIAKWPVLVVVVVAIVALLYWATPNVRPEKFRMLSVGALVAIVVWVVASAGFAFYVANFSAYNKTYGSVAGVVIGLLWLWLTNLALLFGAELDSELERARQLNTGLVAEETIQLPVRDDRGLRKSEKKRLEDLASGRKIREGAVGTGDPDDRPFHRS